MARDENEDISMEKLKPWIQEGLRFKCTECGACCTGEGGYVFLAQSDIERLAKHFNLSETSFKQKYTRLVERGYALLDKKGSTDCIFLEEGKCTLYQARPTQCKTFPWWPNLLNSQKSWEDASLSCEGINHENAPLVSKETIQSEQEKYLDNLIEQNFYTS